MEDKERKIWLEEVLENLERQDISIGLLYNGDREKVVFPYIVRERQATIKLKKSLEKLLPIDDEILQALEKYQEIIHDIYFEAGVRIGICMEKELLTMNLE